MPGQIVHIEIPADDTAKGQKFWGSLFGWEFQSFPGPGAVGANHDRALDAGETHSLEPQVERNERATFAAEGPDLLRRVHRLIGAMEDASMLAQRDQVARQREDGLRVGALIRDVP